MSKKLIMVDGVPKLIEDVEIVEVDNIKFPETSKEGWGEIDSAVVEGRVIKLKGEGKVTKPNKWKEAFKPKKVGRKRKGVKGITQTPTGHWQARWKYKGYDFYVGVFTTEKDANIGLRNNKKMIMDLIDKGYLVLENNSK